MVYAARQRRAVPWVAAVLLLALPSVVFIASHVILVQFKLQLPEWLGLALACAMWVGGVLGALTTMGALIVTIAGSAQAGISIPSKSLMWALTGASLLALAYLAQVPP